MEFLVQIWSANYAHMYCGYVGIFYQTEIYLRIVLSGFKLNSIGYYTLSICQMIMEWFNSSPNAQQCWITAWPNFYIYKCVHCQNGLWLPSPCLPNYAWQVIFNQNQKFSIKRTVPRHFIIKTQLNIKNKNKMTK